MEWLILVGAVVFIIYLMNKKTDTPEVVKSTPPTMQIQRHPIPKNINIKETDIEDIKLSDEQEKIFQLLETTNDIFYVTGKAGTGKSVLLRYFVSKTKKM